MTSQTRQRGVAANARPTREVAVAERVDPIRLQSFVRARRNLEAAERALVASQGALDHVAADIYEHHRLRQNVDGFDATTGVIVRGAGKKSTAIRR